MARGYHSVMSPPAAHYPSRSRSVSTILTLAQSNLSSTAPLDTYRASRRQNSPSCRLSLVQMVVDFVRFYANKSRANGTATIKSFFLFAFCFAEQMEQPQAVKAKQNYASELVTVPFVPQTKSRVCKQKAHRTNGTATSCSILQYGIANGKAVPFCKMEQLVVVPFILLFVCVAVEPDRFARLVTTSFSTILFPAKRVPWAQEIPWHVIHSGYYLRKGGSGWFLPFRVWLNPKKDYWRLVILKQH